MPPNVEGLRAKGKLTKIEPHINNALPALQKLLEHHNQIDAEHRTRTEVKERMAGKPDADVKKSQEAAVETYRDRRPEIRAAAILDLNTALAEAEVPHELFPPKGKTHFLQFRQEGEGPLRLDDISEEAPYAYGSSAAPLQVEIRRRRSGNPLVTFHYRSPGGGAYAELCKCYVVNGKLKGSYLLKE
jgi:hypothetical protein